MATAMYNNGEDVIFHAAGGTGAGAFTAAKNLAKNGKKFGLSALIRTKKLTAHTRAETLRLHLPLRKSAMPQKILQTKL